MGRHKGGTNLDFSRLYESTQHVVLLATAKPVDLAKLCIRHCVCQVVPHSVSLYGLALKARCFLMWSPSVIFT